MDETNDKTCPACSSQVKAAARICRFCRHSFDDAPPDIQSDTPRMSQPAEPSLVASAMAPAVALEAAVVVAKQTGSGAGSADTGRPPLVNAPYPDPTGFVAYVEDVSDGNPFRGVGSRRASNSGRGTSLPLPGSMILELIVFVVIAIFVVLLIAAYLAQIMPKDLSLPIPADPAAHAQTISHAFRLG